ncbi:peptidylprolyl isomerase [Nocardioides taihuensis]|uniref:Peptidyl-prolyl cis-trans isomerase n=1 Tax=Nocardioides taihuensis TaxID=1835606 RepID=A0ABW0BI95_9ACTN
MSTRPHYRALSRAVTTTALLLGLGLLAGCSGDGDSGVATEASTDGGSAASSASSQGSGGASCSYPNDPAGAAKEVSPPPAQATVSGDVTVTMSTSVGDITADLDADSTPCTVGSFVSLAEQGYFDDTSCHRLTTQGIYVLQCGDPTGTGMGGPGYSFPDELSGSEKYPAGTLAMANAGPDTNGSQFFIVYDDTELPPSYAVFGKVDPASLKTVQEVAKQGTQSGGPDGPPKEKVEIQSVTVG